MRKYRFNRKYYKNVVISCLRPISCKGLKNWQNHWDFLSGLPGLLPLLPSRAVICDSRCSTGFRLFQKPTTTWYLFAMGILMTLYFLWQRKCYSIIADLESEAPYSCSGRLCVAQGNKPIFLLKGENSNYHQQDRSTNY